MSKRNLAGMLDDEHGYHCDNPDVEYESNFYYGALGETVEKDGVCKTCGKNVREVWVYGCELINE